jgi:hypothetical protein
VNANSFDRFAGASAIATAAVTLLYSIAFVIVSRTSAELGPALAALFLTAGGVLGSAVVVAVYGRLRDVQPGFALWAFLLAFTASMGSVIHGGFQLANVLHPPSTIVGADLPSEIDPRGLLAFGLSGLAVLVFAALILRAGGARFSMRLGYTGLVFGALLVLTYLARLIVLDPSNVLVLLPAALAGFIVGPLWYLWLGLEILRHPSEDAGNTA